MDESAAPRVNVFARFKEAARRTPDAVALTVDQTSYGYADLLGRVERAAGALIAKGIGPGDGVALAWPNGLGFVVATLATFAVDGMLVPLNPRFKEDELHHYLTQSKPRVILHTPELGAIIDKVDVTPVLRCTTLDELGAFSGSAPAAAAASAGAAMTGFYMFSSGSTGKSKRITRTQAQVLLEYDALRRTVGLGAKDCILCTVPLFHAHGFANAMLAALLSGGHLVILSTEFNARATAAAIDTHGVTVYPAVPFMFKMLSDTKFATPPSFASTRLFVSAGAALPEATAQKFLELYKKPICQLYGSTETGAITLNFERATAKPGSVGVGLSGTEVSILDENGQPVAAGTVGEVWVRTPAATGQYDGLPELSAQCFAAGAFFAGDLGYVDADGDLYITGRKKLLINVAGYKVDPLEVEEVLARHPNVLESVVVGVSHADSGERIKAFVVLKEPGATSAQTLIDFLAATLAEYKLPKQVEFRNEIPKSPLGKVLRKYLQ